MDYQSHLELIADENLLLSTEATVRSNCCSAHMNQALEVALSQQNSIQTLIDLKQHLLQTILASTDPEAAWLSIAGAVGAALQADYCVVAHVTNHQVTDQAAWWNATQGSRFISPYSIGRLAWLAELNCSDRFAAADLLLLPSNLATSQANDTATTFAGDAAPSDQPQPPADGARLLLGVRYRGHFNAVIVVGRLSPHAPWLESEQHLLASLSDQMAIAVSHIQFQQQVAQQARHQALLEEATQAVCSGLNLDQIFSMVLSGLCSTLHISRSYLMLLKYKNPQLRTPDSGNLPSAKITVVSEWSARSASATTLSSSNQPKASSQADDARPHVSWPKGNGNEAAPTFRLEDCHLCQTAFRQRSAPLILRPTTDSDRLATIHQANSVNGAYDSEIGMLHAAQDVAPIFQLETFPALFLMPLEHQNTILGYVVLQHHGYRHWQPGEITLVQLIAAQLSTAIIQSQTLQRVQSLVKDRTAQLQHSLEVQAKLYEKTRQQIDQLRHLNQLKDDFLSTMSHELRTPLTSMALAIRMLRQAQLSPERQDKYLQILEQQCTQETDLINDLLALQQMESHSTAIHMQRTELKGELQPLAQAFEQHWMTLNKNLKLELHLPSRSLPICTDLDCLHRIIKELLTNASKYADPASTIYLKVIPPPADKQGEVTLTLTNVGSGILPDELPFIFDKFRRGQGVTQRAVQGTGLGLALVKGLVEYLEGAIAVSSHPLDNSLSWETCFTLTLPQYGGDLMPSMAIAKASGQD